MKKTFLLLTLLWMPCLFMFGQPLALTFEEVFSQGITNEYLENIYKDAIHADSSQAVFKTKAEQEIMAKTYMNLLQDFDKFLSNNDFFWEKPTNVFNKIYFNTDGTIDYFLFLFGGSSKEKPAESVQKEFQRLLNLFIQEYKIPLTADTKFSQCGPAVYMPKQK